MPCCVDGTLGRGPSLSRSVTGPSYLWVARTMVCTTADIVQGRQRKNFTRGQRQKQRLMTTEFAPSGKGRFSSFLCSTIPGRTHLVPLVLVSPTTKGPQTHDRRLKRPLPKYLRRREAHPQHLRPAALHFHRDRTVHVPFRSVVVHEMAKGLLKPPEDTAAALGMNLTTLLVAAR